MAIDSKFFAWSIALYPWLSIYGTFVDGISVGDLLLLMDMAYVLKASSTGSSQKKPLSANLHILFLVYCVFSLCFIMFMVDVNIWLVAKRFIKYALFIIIVLFISKGFCDKKEFYKAFMYISRAACIAIILQYIVFFTFGRYVEFKIPFLKYCNDSVESIDYNSQALASFRPHSIFLEPAHFTYFIAAYLIFTLFGDGRESKVNRIGEALFTTFCMISSVSSTAIIVTAVVWGWYLLQLLFNRKASFIENNRVIILLMILVCAMIGVRLYLSSPQLSYSLNRLLFSENERLATSTWGRLDSGKSLVESLVGFQKILGMGIGNLPDASTYLSSVYFMLYCTGYIGTAIYIIWGILAFCETSIEGRLMLIVLAAFCVSSPIIISGYIVVYNAIIYFPRIPSESRFEINKGRYIKV